MRTRVLQQYSHELFVSLRSIVETVQTIENAIPVKLFKILFPLWNVDVIGTQQEGHPYELLEQFIEQGIHEGALSSIETLTHFFGLPNDIVEEKLNFLRAIGHVTGTNTRLALTSLGMQSLQSGMSYRTLETRRNLYFDAFGLRPLPRNHYNLHLLSFEDAQKIQDSSIYCLYSFRSWDNHATSELSQRLDRSSYNLPDKLIISESRGVERAFIPMCIVETHIHDIAHQKMNTRYIVVTHVQGWRDVFFEEIVNSESSIHDLLQSEFDHQGKSIEDLLAKWLSRQRFAQYAHLLQAQDGIWQVHIDAKVFTQANVHLAMMNIRDIGSYRLAQSYLYQIWCDEPPIRRTAALEQTIAFIERNKQQRLMKQLTIHNFMQRITEHLKIEPLAWYDLRDYAKNVGKLAIVDDMEDQAIEEGYE